MVVAKYLLIRFYLTSTRRNIHKPFFFFFGAGNGKSNKNLMSYKEM